MASTPKTTRNEIKHFFHAKKLQQVTAALLLAGLSGAFSSPARAQETRQNVFSNQKVDLSRHGGRRRLAFRWL